MADSSDHNKKAIGIFDSGIGGLTVFKEIRRKLSNEKIVYLGDTARVPYGIRSAQTVLRYSIANADFLLQQNIKLLVIACNTVSAVAVDVLREKYTIPVIDVVGPGARRAVNITKNKKVGIIGTEATIKSSAYQNEIRRMCPDIEIFTQSCPLFVPLAEEGWCSSDDEVVRLVSRRYLERMKDFDIDTLVLGCTHYPLLKDAIKMIMGKNIKLVDSAEETALEVTTLLNRKSLLYSGEAENKSFFFLTDIPDRFIETARLFLGEGLENVKLIDI